MTCILPIVWEDCIIFGVDYIILCMDYIILWEDYLYPFLDELCHTLNQLYTVYTGKIISSVGWIILYFGKILSYVVWITLYFGKIIIYIIPSISMQRQHFTTMHNYMSSYDAIFNKQK